MDFPVYHCLLNVLDNFLWMVTVVNVAYTWCMCSCMEKDKNGERETFFKGSVKKHGFCSKKCEGLEQSQLQN